MPSQHARAEPISGSRASAPGLGHFVKGLIQRREDRDLSSVLFPALDRDIDIPGVKFDGSRATSGLFCRNQDRSAPTKGIENEAASLGAILDRIGNHRDRLY